MLTSAEPSSSKASLQALPYSLLVSKLLVFSDAKDLVRVGATCRLLHVAAEDHRLWQRLLFLDFSGPRIKRLDANLEAALAAPFRAGAATFLEELADARADEENSVEETASDLPSIEDAQLRGQADASLNEQNNFAKSKFAEPSPQEGLVYPCGAKIAYLRRMQDFEERIKLASKEREIDKQIAALRKRRERIELTVRIICLEITTPMIGIAPFVMLMLGALQLDQKIPENTWIVIAPFLLFMILLAIDIVIGTVLFLKRDVDESIFFGMYYKFRGFVQFWMHKVFRENSRALISGFFLYLFLFLWVILVGIRLERDDAVTWTGVFVPFWGMLIIFALSPVLKWGGADEDMESFKEPYVVLMCSVWVPVMAFSLVLPLFLDEHINASIGVVLIPLWVLEGEMAIFLLVTLGQSLYHKKDISDSLLVVFVMLIMFTPLVAFQVMLIVKLRDNNGIPFLKVFTPLFLWFSLCTLTLINYLVQYERPSSAEMSSAHPLLMKKQRLNAEFRRSRGHSRNFSGHDDADEMFRRFRRREAYNERLALEFMV